MAVEQFGQKSHAHGEANQAFRDELFHRVEEGETGRWRGDRVADMRARGLSGESDEGRGPVERGYAAIFMMNAGW